MSVSAPPPSVYRRRRTAAAVGLLGVAALVALVVVLLTGGSGAGSSGGGGAPAAVVPADALAYVDLDINRKDPAVTQALEVLQRLPDFAVLATAASSRLGSVLGGQSLDFSTGVSPWLGGGAALALLNTTTSTAGALIVVDVTDEARARSFLRSAGATARGSYRGHALLTASNGDELAFAHGELLIGQDAAVREAIDVAAGARPSLAASPTYRRATQGQGSGSVLDAYASAAGVRRVLADQSGILGAIGGLLSQPALQAVAIALTPTQKGAAIRIHSALDPALEKVGPNASPPAAFTPTLPALMPAASSLLLDVADLARVAPTVLDAGSAAGVAGGIGPLLTRLGSALRSEGVNVSDLTSIFRHEAAVAVVGGGQSPALVVVARTTDQAQTQHELAQLEAPLAQLFSTPGKNQSSEPVFNDRQLGAVTAHQLQLTTGFQLDYAVFHGLVVISTSLAGVQDVADQTRSLAHDPGYDAVLGGATSQTTSLVFANVAALLSATQQSGSSAGSLTARLMPDLRAITGVGLTSTRGAADSTTQVTVAVKR
ncbi:MAG TPA: DUF3352 domain-containing protein [Solirubrobacteraceae bacterium]|nr:DUF3352 domain-containing protein [Solirubrobacteraceae bacterium]